jgi:hypothetical protein
MSELFLVFVGMAMISWHNLRKSLKGIKKKKTVIQSAIKYVTWLSVPEVFKI